MGREARVWKTRTDRRTGEKHHATADGLRDQVRTAERLEALGLIRAGDVRDLERKDYEIIRLED